MTSPTKEQAHTATHTPGPWGMTTVRTSCGVCHKVGPWPHKWRAGAEMSACIYDDYPSPPEGTDTMLANARLIAAAPDLLAALQAARAVIQDDRDAMFESVTVAGIASTLQEIDRPPLDRLDAALADIDAALARATGAAK